LERQLSAFIPEFLLRQPLRELHVCSVMQISLPAFFRFLRAAPVIFFSVSWLSNHATADCSAFTLSQPPTITRLSFTHGCDALCHILALPQFAFHLAALRDLEFAVPFVHDKDCSGHGLISSAAPTLERLRVVTDGGSSSDSCMLPIAC
jgi:hypothetical protein